MNVKWYLDESGIRVKKCAKCKNPYPYNTDNFPSRGAGRYSAYCMSCYRVLARERQQRNKKTNKIHIKNIVFVGDDGRSYKKCTKCGVTKLHTIDFFDFQERGQEGLHASCKECRKIHTKELKKIYWYKTLMKNARMSSYVREYEKMDVDEEFLINLWNRQNGKCYWFGIEMIPSTETKTLLQPSLDRLDRNRGYVKDNVVLCCFAANFGRNQSGEDEWKKFLLKIKEESDFGMWQQ